MYFHFTVPANQTINGRDNFTHQTRDYSVRRRPLNPPQTRWASFKVAIVAWWASVSVAIVAWLTSFRVAILTWCTSVGVAMNRIGLNLCTVPLLVESACKSNDKCDWMWIH